MKDCKERYQVGKLRGQDLQEKEDTFREVQSSLRNKKRDLKTAKKHIKKERNLDKTSREVQNPLRNKKRDRNTGKKDIREGRNVDKTCITWKTLLEESKALSEVIIGMEDCENKKDASRGIQSPHQKRGIKD